MNTKTNVLTPELLLKLDAYWRAANCLSVGQIYLYDNPLLKRPLTLVYVKHMLLGHWGTTSGQNFMYHRPPATDRGQGHLPEAAAQGQVDRA